MILSIQLSKSSHARVELVDALLDLTGGDEKHPLAGTITAISRTIEEYEREHVDIPDASPREVLQFLMDQHGLKQIDLRDIVSQGNLSSILKGTRSISKRLALSFAEKFSVSPTVFLEKKRKMTSRDENRQSAMA